MGSSNASFPALLFFFLNSHFCFLTPKSFGFYSSFCVFCLFLFLNYFLYCFCHFLNFFFFGQYFDFPLSRLTILGIPAQTTFYATLERGVCIYTFVYTYTLKSKFHLSVKINFVHWALWMKVKNYSLLLVSDLDAKGEDWGSIILVNSLCSWLWHEGTAAHRVPLNSRQINLEGGWQLVICV